MIIKAIIGYWFDFGTGGKPSRIGADTPGSITSPAKPHPLAGAPAMRRLNAKALVAIYT
jgi:hypothetical protein